MAKQRNGKQLMLIEQAHEEQQVALAAELSSRYVAAYPHDLDGAWFHILAEYRIGRNAEAKQQLESRLAQFSDDFRGPVLTILARINRDQGDLAEAERCYLQSIDADACDACNYVELGEMMFAAGQVAAAEQIVRKGIANEALPLEDLHYLQGTLCRANGDLAAAYLAFCEVVDAIDHPEAEAAIVDIEAAAQVRGIELPQVDSMSEDETSESEGDEDEPVVDQAQESDEGEDEHVPGEMVLNIHREYFLEILSGEKKIEYRTVSEYWRTRVENAGEPPFHLRVINGMSKQAPELTVICDKVLINPWQMEYELHLGTILEVKNWDHTAPPEEEDEEEDEEE